MNVNTSNAILATIEPLSRRMELMEGHMIAIQGSVCKIDGTIVNMERRLNSTQSTPQNYNASSSIHAQNTSITIFTETLHQIYNPPRQAQDQTNYNPTYPNDRNLVRPFQSQFNQFNQEVPQKYDLPHRMPHDQGLHQAPPNQNLQPQEPLDQNQPVRAEEDPS